MILSGGDWRGGYVRFCINKSGKSRNMLKEGYIIFIRYIESKIRMI